MPAGRLEVIYGCMFAGKTTELIRRLSAAGALGLSAVAVKPRIDVRSGSSRLTTHGGVSVEAIECEDAAAIPGAVGSARVVAIDEAHFFGAGLVRSCRALLDDGRRVIVAGVHLDHRGRPFEPFPGLLPIADESLQLFAACAVCGKPANHSHRKVAAEGRIVVGGADLYEPRCDACFPPDPG